MSNEDILNAGAAATMLHVESETILQLAGRGDLPGTRIGKSWVFLREDVIEFLKKQISRDTEERRRQLASVDADAALLPATPNKCRRQLPALPTMHMSTKR